MTMLRSFLFLHWKAARFGLVPFILAAFGLPLLAVQGAMPAAVDPSLATVRGAAFLSHLSVWLGLFPLLATVTGVVVALSAWTWDHRGEHVYALTLPLARWKYVGLKMGAGVLLLLVPTLAFWLGCLLATSALEIPEGLRAYPNAVAFRFFLSALILYALLFALAAGTMRTALWILGGFVALVILGGILPPFLADTFVPALEGWSFFGWFLDAALEWPGPFEVLTGNWMLVDV
jgi:hypothetical protein